MDGLSCRGFQKHCYQKLRLYCLGRLQFVYSVGFGFLVQLLILLFPIYAYCHQQAGERVRHDVKCTNIATTQWLILLTFAVQALGTYLQGYFICVCMLASDENIIETLKWCFTSQNLSSPNGHCCMCCLGRIVNMVSILSLVFLFVLEGWYIVEFLQISGGCYAEISMVGSPLYAFSIEIYGWYLVSSALGVVSILGYCASTYLCGSYFHQDECAEPVVSNYQQIPYTKEDPKIPERVVIGQPVVSSHSEADIDIT